jgi:hypothetical protein
MQLKIIKITVFSSQKEVVYSSSRRAEGNSENVEKRKEQ